MSEVDTKKPTTDAPKDNKEGGYKKNYNKEYNKEEKGEKQPYKHKPRNIFKEKTIVTLDTVVPDMPKKGDLHAKPDDDLFQSALDKMQSAIDEAYKKMSDIAREARNKNFLPADKTFEDLIGLLKVKQEERKKASDELQGVVTEKEVYKKQVDDFNDKSTELRLKMKVPGKKTDLEAQLKQLKGLQSKGKITMAEEKNLIKEISELERSLPFAGPLEELEEQSKEAREQYKALRGKSAQKFEVVKLLRDECRQIQEKIDKQREEHEKTKEETTPIIEKAKDEFRNLINSLKQKKKDAYDNHNSAWRKHEEQQAEIETIKFIKRKKEKLLRDEARRKRDEEWKKQKEAEEEDNKEVPYRTQIELCDLLIGYCSKLVRTTQDVAAALQKDKNTVIQEALQHDDWKTAKGQYILNRKEKDDSFFAGGNKKKTQKKEQTKPKEEDSVQSLNHQFETLNYFEEIKISPPLITSKIADTLKTLQEKKAYYEKLSAEALATEESRKGMTDEERKKHDEEEKAKKASEQDNNKKEHTKKKAQPKFDPESEHDFPKM